MQRSSNMIRQSPGEQGFAPPFQPQLTVTTSYPYGANQLGSFSPYNQPVRSAFNNLLAHDWSDASAQLSVGPTYGSSPKQSPLVRPLPFLLLILDLFIILVILPSHRYDVDIVAFFLHHTLVPCCHGLTNREGRNFDS